MSTWHVFACPSLVSLLGLTGCTVHPPAQLYQLDVGVAAVSKKDGGVTVLLGPIQLADYLRRDVMVQRQTGGILSLSAGTRWTGNLETNVSQQLLRQMSNELGNSHLALSPEKPGFTPQVQVMLTISRLDSGPKQPAVIEVRWRLLDRKDDLKDSRVFHKEERHQGGIGDQIRAQNNLPKRLATQLAKDVKPTAMATKAPPPATARKLAAKPKAKEEEGPEVPLMVPIRTDTKVYRF